MTATKQRSKKVKAKLFEAQQGACCYCSRPVWLNDHSSQSTFPMRSKRGKPYSAFMGTVEHLRRKAEGGTSRIDNLALACLQCNTARGERDWLSYKSMFDGSFEMEAA